MRQIVPRGRVVGLDVARCLALLGMIATHALVSRTPEGGPTFVQEVAGGRSSALFAVLAGASMALMSGRTEPVTGRAGVRVGARLVVRAMLVTLIGLVLGELDTSIAVILTYYGVLFLLGIPFLQLRAVPLAVLASLGVVIAPVVSHLVRQYLPPPSYESPDLGMLLSPLQLLTELTFTGYYPAATWLPYLVAGMALGRADLTPRRLAVALALGGQAVALLAKGISSLLLAQPGVSDVLTRTFTGPGDAGDLENTLAHGLYGVTPTGSWWWLAVSAPHSGTAFDLAHTIGTSLSVIGVCLLVAPLAPRVFAVVFGAGTMTLTLYSLHVVLRVPEAWPEDSVESFLRHAGLVLAIGAAYRLAGRSGPLERLVAFLSARAVPPPRAAPAEPARRSR